MILLISYLWGSGGAVALTVMILRVDRGRHGRLNIHPVATWRHTGQRVKRARHTARTPRGTGRRQAVAA